MGYILYIFYIYCTLNGCPYLISVSHDWITFLTYGIESFSVSYHFTFLFMVLQMLITRNIHKIKSRCEPLCGEDVTVTRNNTGK